MVSLCTGECFNCSNSLNKPFNDQCFLYIEIRQLIHSAKQLTGFYIETLAVEGLRSDLHWLDVFLLLEIISNFISLLNYKYQFVSFKFYIGWNSLTWGLPTYILLLYYYIIYYFIILFLLYHIFDSYYWRNRWN